jgi:hypothetical protein
MPRRTRLELEVAIGDAFLVAEVHCNDELLIKPPCKLLVKALLHQVLHVWPINCELDFVRTYTYMVACYIRQIETGMRNSKQLAMRCHVTVRKVNTIYQRRIP